MVGGRTISETAVRAYPLRAIAMRPTVHGFGILDRTDRLWAAAILFINGWNFALPIADVALPVWFTPIQVVHGIFLHEALLAAYTCYFVFARLRHLRQVPRRAWQFAFLIAGLGILAWISALVNLRPMVEFLGAGRYILLAAYFLLAVYWTRRHGLTFVLHYLLLGVVSAGLINLYYTFKIRSNALGGIPLLLGEQGPGGYLGFTVILSAWLMLERRRKADTIIAVASSLVSLFAVSISFSKLAMLMAAVGSLAWLLVLWRDLRTPGRRKWYAVIIPAVVALVWMNQEVTAQYVRGAKRFVDVKFKYVDVESVAARSQYFLITAEIVARHPLFGVSYGGFYDAAMATEASKSSFAAIENPEAGARGESNPHSSLLYYASANGIPGILLTVTMLSFALILMARPMLRRGIAGLAVWGSFAFGYAIFILTLPTLFNSAILYLPVAVAICMRRPRLRYRTR